MKLHITQCRIVKYINDFGSITTLEAMRDIGVTNLHALSTFFFLTISILYYNTEINKLI